MSRLLLVHDELDSMDMIRWAPATPVLPRTRSARPRPGTGAPGNRCQQVQSRCGRYQIPRGSRGGLKVINQLRTEWPDCLIIAVTRQREGDESINVTGDKAMRAGANDFLSKLDKATGAAYFSQRLLDRLLFWKGCIGR